MHHARLSHPADIGGWRREARIAIALNIEPEAIVWSVGDDADLLATARPTAAAAPFSVPKKFLDLAKKALLHRDPERFGLMYRLLWRVRAQPGLLDDAVDPDVWRAARMAKAVHRDIHKMHAFVRFKELTEESRTLWLAWFEPEHHILEAAVPHFRERFAALNWSILTPERSVTWTGTELAFGPGATRDAVPQTDRLDEHWRTYYRSIFNPARLKIGAMTKEMPKKYWKNLPESTEIQSLIRAADARMQSMVDCGATEPSPMTNVEARRRAPAAPIADEDTREGLTQSINACARCPIGSCATQAVLGEGPRDARLMIVGEQPGDQEDLIGRPFVGPAGKLLDDALRRADIDRTSAYVTNAVKHFKFEARGKRWLHKTPTAAEIDHCRWWLERERTLVKPKLIIALGGTAVRGITGRSVTIGQERGRVHVLEDGSHLVVTVHPSYLLRLLDEHARVQETEKFIADLNLARQWLAQAA